MNKIRCGKSKIKKRAVSVLLSLSISLSSLAGYQFSQKVNAAQDVMLHNPIIVEDSAMEAGQKVTWDCVWFGSYPQTEVKETDSEYASLKSAAGWDGNGDIAVNGTKYRRMLKGDATYATSGSSNYYDWEDDTTYHYFRYEPVKWRVLKTDGSNAMLLSDIVLDDRKYNTEYKNTTWETSTIRSWLNGYDADMNQEDISYSRSNFIDSAFTIEEQSVITDTNVVNNDNLSYDTKGGNDTNGIKNTIDKLFLLSESEVYTDNAVICGFVSRQIADEARRCKSSDYAKAMGVYSDTSTYKGSCRWWLRSPGYYSINAANVSSDGCIYYYGSNVHYYNYGVRVALNLNLSSSNLYEYAGTVCSDGTVDVTKEPSTEKLTTEEPGAEESTTEEPSTEESTTEEPSTEEATTEQPPTKQPQTIEVTQSYTKAYGVKAFKLNAKLIKGNGALRYAASDQNIADVDENGKVTINDTGICTITVTASATDAYEAASANINITVKPKKNAVTKVKLEGSRTLNVTWKKDTKGSGYELQYSTSDNFTSKTTVTVNIGKNKTTSYKIRKLTRGKKYYIRIRAYRNVEVNGKTEKLYGDWSTVKQKKSKAVTYKIKYVLMGGVNNVKNPTIYSSEKSVVLRTPTRAGYHFRGWYTEKTFKKKIVKIKKGTKGTITLYAGWEKKYPAALGSATITGCSATAKDTVRVKASIPHYLNSSDKYYYLARVSPLTGAFIKTVKKVRKSKNVCFILKPSEDGGYVQNRYAIAVKKGKKYILISSPQYVKTPEKAAANTKKYTVPKTKKGIQYTNYSELKKTGANTTFMNLPISSVLGGSVKYRYNGKDYYFSDLSGYRAAISSFNSEKINITLQIMLDWGDGSNVGLIAPEARVYGKSYYTWNTSDRTSREKMEAIFSYLGTIFGTKACHVDNWILGNEVNACDQWNYKGSMSNEDFIKSYSYTFVSLYKAVKSNSANSKVFVCIDHSWNVNNNGFAAKDFLNRFNSQVKQIMPNINWNVAVHPYPTPLTSSDFWNNANVYDSENSPYVTMKNIDVFTNYIRNHFSSKTRVILSELGYTSTSGQNVQAAAIALAYYKAACNPMIDAFIIRSYCDNAVESAMGLTMGISGKEAFNVFKYMDTSIGLSYTNRYLRTIGISSWKSAVPNFKVNRLSKTYRKEAKSNR